VDSHTRQTLPEGSGDEPVTVREGDTLAGRYRLRARLGSGGMSEVWLADDEELGRSVAVKLLAPTADRVRLEREARAYAACSHSNVACVYDYGEIRNRPYIVLEHLPGGTLEDRLAAHAPLPDDDTARIATEVAAGIAHAHSQGLVHRDLKPANVLFDDEGRAKIADFGIAYATDASTLTDAGTIVGTAAYASPEQATGQPVTPASDVYSFGVILFEMLTGTRPFTGANPMELLAQHSGAEPPPVRRFRGDAPPHLEALTTAALAKDPRARPSDGTALLAALSPPTGAAADTAPTLEFVPARPRPSRRAAIGAAAALAVLVLVGFAAAVLALDSSSSSQTPPAGTRGQQHTSGSRTQPPTESATSSSTTSTESRTTGLRGREPPPTRTVPVSPGATPTSVESTTTPTETTSTTTETSGTTTTPTAP
jgi:serine/threonine protein kinase